MDNESFVKMLAGKRLLGLDLGTKTIGLALSDSFWMVASPLPVLKRKKFTLDANTLLSLIKGHDISGLVFGLPLNMDGSRGPRVQSTEAFVRNFEKLSDIPITYWDERLSTIAAERALLESDTSRAKRSEKIDSIAASLILQSALERFKTLL